MAIECINPVTGENLKTISETPTDNIESIISEVQNAQKRVEEINC